MKKVGKSILGVILAFVMVSLVACGGGDPTPEPDGDAKYSYSLTETSITLNEEQTKQLGVNVTPSKEISPEFSSANADVATVTSGGLITAVGEGSTTVTVKVDGETLTCAVTVKGYTLNFTALSLVNGQTKQLAVTHGDQAVSGVKYASANSSVASVSESGLVTAAGVGETTVTASVDGVSIVCTVKVTADYVYSLNKTALDLALGSSEVLAVSVTPDKEFDKPVVFTSSDTSVVTVGEGNGEVNAVSTGSATVTCMVDGHELTCAVTVTEYTLSTSSLIVRMGETSDPIEVTANPEKEVTPKFSSDDESIATVDEHGAVTAVSIGNTVVKVKVGDSTLEVAVEVKAARTYGLNKSKSDLLLGSTDKNTVQLEVTVDPAGTIGDVTWTSSDDTVATVGDDGLVTAVKVGSATITAEVDGNTLECEVNVAIAAEMSAENARGKSYNLTVLDNDYYTVDWVYYGRDDYTERMANRTELIGTAPAHDRYFFDYQANMSWSDGVTNESANGRNDGRVYIDTVNQEITVNKNVSKIVAFVGAYNATNRVSAWMSGVELANFSFTSSGSSVNQVITIVPDTTALGETQNATLTFRMERQGENADNISMVAIAVIGKEARPEATTSVTMVKNEMTGSMNVARNLTDVGTDDWRYMVFTGDEGGDSKKDGSGAILVDTFARTGTTGIGWDYKCKFTWTDGTKWTDNPKDAGDDSGSWGSLPDGDPGRGTNNFLYGDSASIQVQLGVGTYKVYLYVSGWNSVYEASMKDGNGKNLLTETIWETFPDANISHAYELVYTVEVTQEDTFTFILNKLQGGNVGLAAIAVATQA